MGRFSGIVSALNAAWNWIVRLVKKASNSVPHLIAISNDAEWFYLKYEELEPEAQVRIDDMIYHIEELKKIWGIE